VEIWKFKAYLSKLKDPAEYARFCALSVTEQNEEIENYWESGRDLKHARP